MIRASEIGTYLYCKRAWWYHSQGIESQNQTEMSEGSAYHRNHGRQVLAAMILRSLAWVFLLAAVILLAIGITRWLTG